MPIFPLRFSSSSPPSSSSSNSSSSPTPSPPAALHSKPPRKKKRRITLLLSLPLLFLLFLLIPFILLPLLFHSPTLFPTIFLWKVTGCKETEPAQSAEQLKKQKELGSIEVFGEGFQRAILFEQTCFEILARDKNGKNLNSKCRQDVFYTVLLEAEGGKIKQMANVEFNSSKASHRACYIVAVKARFHVSVYISFLGAHGIRTGLHASEDRLSPPLRFLGRGAVKEGEIEVENNPALSPEQFWDALPPCPLSSSSSSSFSSSSSAHFEGDGFWTGSKWTSLSCRVPSLTMESLAKCFNGKNILLVGDSQMRYTFAQLFGFLKWGDRDRFFARHKNQPRHVENLFLKEAANQTAEDAPVESKSAKVILSETDFHHAGKVQFLGTKWEGFARSRAKVLQLKRRGPARNLAEFNVSYIVHLYANQPILKPWMSHGALFDDPSLALSRRDFPFDVVLATTGLHDLSIFRNSEQFSSALEQNMLKSLLRLVRHPDDISWVGIWAAQETMKREAHLPHSNNVRGFSFEDAAKRTVKKHGVKKWIDVRGMTTPRRDLCLDSTHYSWPISMATIEAWIGSICPS